jgi:hypothetical protein
MSDQVIIPDHIKFRRETETGLVYDHENYGYEDATLTKVGETVIDILEWINEEGGCSYPSLEDEYSPQTIDTLLESGVLTRA